MRRCVLIGVSLLVLSVVTDSAFAETEATGRIPALRATVVGLRFFESPQPPTTRHYDDLFFFNAARYIFWELDLSHPALGRRTSLTVEDVWHAPRGEIRYRGARTFTLESNWSDSFVYAGARVVGTKTVDNPLATIPAPSCLEGNRERRNRNEPEIACPGVGHGTVELERWQEGPYRVDLFVDGHLVATGVFRMDEKNQIYGEVFRRRPIGPPRSAPSGDSMPR
jgi:hypothetical protein